MKELLLVALGIILFIYLNILIMAENPCSAFSMTQSDCHSGELN